MITLIRYTIDIELKLDVCLKARPEDVRFLKLKEEMN